jgi:hypothetical protein
MSQEFQFTVESLPATPGVHVQVARGETVLDFATVLELWRDHAGFVEAFTDELRSCPFAAYFFETPPLTVATRDRVFECVLIDAPALARTRANAASFGAKLDPEREVSTFANLGGDAVLVVPSDRGADCAHLASFVRTAEVTQVRALWRAAAEAVLGELGDAPRWLSSSGLGVPWLHLRVDSRPKYYSYAPYRAFPGR